MSVEWVPHILRRRYREVGPLTRPRLGESADELKARTDIYGHPERISPSVRRFIAGAVGPTYSKGDSE